MSYRSSFTLHLKHLQSFIRLTACQVISFKSKFTRLPQNFLLSVTWLQFLSVQLNALSSHDRYTKGFIMFKNVFETDSVVGKCDDKGSWFCYSALIGIRKASL